MSIPRFTPDAAGPEGGRPTPGADPGGYHLHHAQGDRVWFAGALLTFKAKAADTRGILSFCQVDCLRGWQAPVHTHDEEAEPFFVLEVGENYGWNLVEPFPRTRDGAHS